MARIDPILQAGRRARAERVILATGERIVLVVGGQRRNAGPQPVTVEQIQALVAEIVPPDMAPQIASDGEHEFTYASPIGDVLIQIVRNGRALHLVASQPEEPAAAAQAAPAGARKGTHAQAPSTGPPATIDTLFLRMVEENCSDLHLSVDRPPMFRKHGDMVALDGAQPLNADQVRSLLHPIVPGAKLTEFEERHDSDFSYAIEGVARFRCNIFRDHKGMGGVFRVIPSEILSPEQLGLSRHILDLCDLKKGLVLVTGPTGSGKSTTLASMIDHINRTRPVHIITIEDPIEFVHPARKALINQREIGSHTMGFKNALRAALREDPDIVLVGEMRDLETTAIAIETAETGHLVFGTLHTNTAPSTIDRAIDQFPADRQNQVRTMLSECLKGVVSQTLLRKKGGGRIAALEILLVTPAVSNLIREAKTYQIPSIMQTAKAQGMVTLGDALLDLVRRDLVEPDEAYANAVNKSEFKALLDRVNIKLKAA